MSNPTTPLLVDDATPELIDEEEVEDETTPALQEEEDDFPDDTIVAGLVISLTAMTNNNSIGCHHHHHNLMYPRFQSGYSSPTRGNPLPARMAQYCERYMTVEALQGHWKQLLHDLDIPMVQYQTRRVVLITSLVAVLVIATPLLIPVLIHSSSTREASMVVFLATATLVAWYQALKCFTQEPLQLTVNDIVQQHALIWKTQARIQLKLISPKTSWCSSCLRLLGCCQSQHHQQQRQQQQHLIIVFQKYVPVAERQAQIAFV